MCCNLKSSIRAKQYEQTLTTRIYCTEVYNRVNGATINWTVMKARLPRSCITYVYNGLIAINIKFKTAMMQCVNCRLVHGRV